MKPTTSFSTKMKSQKMATSNLTLPIAALLLSIFHSMAFPETESNGFNFLLIAIVVMQGLLKINKNLVEAQTRVPPPIQIQDMKAVKNMLTDIQTNLDVNSQALNLLVKTTLDEK